MAVISRFRNNTTHTRVQHPLFLVPSSYHRVSWRSKGSIRTTTGGTYTRRNTGSLFFLLVFHDTTFHAHGAAATLYVVIECIRKDCLLASTTF